MKKRITVLMHHKRLLSFAKLTLIVVIYSKAKQVQVQSKKQKISKNILAKIYNTSPSVQSNIIFNINYIFEGVVIHFDKKNVLILMHIWRVSRLSG